jgi:uracil-DNA glycosylase
MHYNSVFLDSLDFIDNSWKGFLSEKLIDLLRDIEERILQEDSEYTPKANHVLRFFSKPLSDIKIVILGQDPYPQKGVATGRAFEVGTLHSWNSKFNNISLKNIIRAIYFAYKNEYLKYSEIKDKLGKTFHIKPPNELFIEWEKQGVLLLNTSFTCTVDKSNSHEKYWKPFTNQLLRYITYANPNVMWFLWGNNAKSIVSDVNIKNKIESMHPMMCYNRPDRNEDFLFGKKNAFKETMSLINWLG